MSSHTSGSDFRVASFRDPSGFVYQRDGVLYRQFSPTYKQDYDMLMQSGLYQELIAGRLLVSHEEVSLSLAYHPDNAAIVIRPERIPFLSYAHEWSFGQLKAAALLTLDIMEKALAHGMILKDATTRNVQFSGASPVFIDTGSFVKHDGGPWIAYRQFCEHFLLPLTLRSRLSPAMAELERGFSDGIPLQAGVDMLPLRAWLSPSTLLHCILHARFAKGYGQGNASRPEGKANLPRLVSSLRSGVESLSFTPRRTAWGAYDPLTLYPDSVQQKQAGVRQALERVKPSLVWDMGANDGFYSFLAAEHAKTVIAMESDPDALERCYQQTHASHTNVLPLSVDLNRPTSGGGVMGREMLPLSARAQPDLVMLLGIIHHLVITQNIPFAVVLQSLRESGARHVLLEWITPDDERAAALLRAKVHHPYSRTDLDAAFAGVALLSEIPVSSTRTLLLYSL